MVLITGGLGFIGLHVARAFIDAGEKVVATRHNRSDVPSFLEKEVGKNFFVEKVDVVDRASLLAACKKHNVDSVMQLVAPPLGTASMLDEYHTNLDGLMNVLDVARELGMRRMTLGSSLAVYLGAAPGPHKEESPLPISSATPTDLFKKCEELLAFHFAMRHKLDVRAIRFASIYGPGYRSLVNAPSRVVHAAVQGKPGPLPNAVVPKVVADAANDFCYVKDAARAAVMLHQSPNLKHNVYNVGAGRATSPREFEAAVKKIIPTASNTFEPGGGNSSNNYMDIGRLIADTGYKPQFALDAAVVDYVAWLREGHDR